MRINLQVTDEVAPAIRRFVASTLPSRRREAVETTLQDALGDVIQQNPVDTARSRAAWVASLERLGGAPPAGWQGPTPTGEAEGRTAGSLLRHNDQDSSSAAAANAVRYVPFLEYGTSRISPIGMVRGALLLAREKFLDRLQRMFR